MDAFELRLQCLELAHRGEGNANTERIVKRAQCYADFILGLHSPALPRDTAGKGPKPDQRTQRSRSRKKS